MTAQFSELSSEVRIPVLFALILLPAPAFLVIGEYLETDLRLHEIWSISAALAVTVTGVVLLLTLIKVQPVEATDFEGKTALINSKTQAIKALNLQRYLFGAILVSLAAYIAYQAQQTIFFAAGGSEYGIEIANTNSRINSLQTELRDALKYESDGKNANAPLNLTELELALRQTAVTELSAQIVAERETLDKLYASQDANQGKISTSFLFSYFSDFFVRVATLGVSISFFSILLGQYRRIEERIARYTAIKSALLLELGQWNSAAIRTNTPAMLVLENAPKSAGDDTEIALPKSVIQNIVGAVADLGIKEMVNGKDTTPRK